VHQSGSVCALRMRLLRPPTQLLSWHVEPEVESGQLPKEPLRLQCGFSLQTPVEVEVRRLTTNF